jgi:DNA-directed RNA polymerase subunit RPC12/RpoP
MAESRLYDQLKGEGKVRTDLFCTECSKNFVGEIDFDIDGNHIIICPYCGHEHCRVINNGTITDDRWDSRMQTTKSMTQRVWSDESRKIKTSSASHFLRQRWLNLGAEGVL